VKRRPSKGKPDKSDTLPGAAEPWRLDMARTAELLAGVLHAWHAAELARVELYTKTNHPPATLPPERGPLRFALIDASRRDSRLFAWLDRHIAEPLGQLDSADKQRPDNVAVLVRRLLVLVDFLREGTDFAHLSWEVGTHAQEAARRLLAAVAAWLADAIKRAGTVRVHVAPTNAGSVVRVNPGPSLDPGDLGTVMAVGRPAPAMVADLLHWSATDHAEDAGPGDALGFLRALADHGEAVARARFPAPPEPPARSEMQGVAAWIGAAIDHWRQGPDMAERHGPGGGPSIDPRALERLGAIGGPAVRAASELQAWGTMAREEALARPPMEALSFLEALDSLGEAEALRRWPAAADRKPPGLDALCAKHPDLCAKPGPKAVLRVLLADPAKLWSARKLASAAADFLSSETASPRAVGRWLAELACAGLACAEGRGTAKRWRLGAA
jgi:hypothetical protein